MWIRKLRIACQTRESRLRLLLCVTTVGVRRWVGKVGRHTVVEQLETHRPSLVIIVQDCSLDHS